MQMSRYEFWRAVRWGIVFGCAFSALAQIVRML